MAKNMNEGGAVKLTGVQTVKSLMAQMQEAKGKSSKINGSIGSLLKEAEDKKALHIKAFKTCATLDRMDGSTLRSFLTNFDHYRECLQLDKRAKEQGDFIADEAEVTLKSAKNKKAGGKGTPKGSKAGPAATAKKAADKSQRELEDAIKASAKKDRKGPKDRSADLAKIIGDTAKTMTKPMEDAAKEEQETLAAASASASEENGGIPFNTPRH